MSQHQLTPTIPSRPLAPPTDPAYERAVRGADWLDLEAGPNWEDRVNVATLALASTCRCVLGQVFSGFTTVFERLASTRNLLIAIDPVEHGFVAATAGDYEGLQAAWERLLAERAQAREAT